MYDRIKGRAPILDTYARSMARQWQGYEAIPIEERQRLFFNSTNIGMKRIYIVIAGMRKAR